MVQGLIVFHRNMLERFFVSKKNGNREHTVVRFLNHNWKKFEVECENRHGKMRWNFYKKLSAMDMFFSLLKGRKEE